MQIFSFSWKVLPVLAVLLVLLSYSTREEGAICPYEPEFIWEPAVEEIERRLFSDSYIFLKNISPNSAPEKCPDPAKGVLVCNSSISDMHFSLLYTYKKDEQSSRRTKQILLNTSYRTEKEIRENRIIFAEFLDRNFTNIRKTEKYLKSMIDIVTFNYYISSIEASDEEPEEAHEMAKEVLDIFGLDLPFSEYDSVVTNIDEIFLNEDGKLKKIEEVEEEMEKTVESIEMSMSEAVEWIYKVHPYIWKIEEDYGLSINNLNEIVKIFAEKKIGSEYNNNISLLGKLSKLLREIYLLKRLSINLSHYDEAWMQLMCIRHYGVEDRVLTVSVEYGERIKLVKLEENVLERLVSGGTFEEIDKIAEEYMHHIKD